MAGGPGLKGSSERRKGLMTEIRFGLGYCQSSPAVSVSERRNPNPGPMSCCTPAVSVQLGHLLQLELEKALELRRRKFAGQAV